MHLQKHHIHHLANESSLSHGRGGWPSKLRLLSTLFYNQRKRLTPKLPDSKVNDF